MRLHRLDVVDAAARDSTRLAREPRQFRDSVVPAQDYKLDAEKCGLELERLKKDPESPDALELLRQITALKQKQELLHKGPFATNQRALESLQAAEDQRLEHSVAFRGDESGISRERLEHIQCVLRNPRKVPSHLDAARWMDVFRSQPWY